MDFAVNVAAALTAECHFYDKNIYTKNKSSQNTSQKRRI